MHTHKGAWAEENSAKNWGKGQHYFHPPPGWMDSKVCLQAPILWPLDAKSQLIGKDLDAGKDWRQKEKGAAEDEIASPTWWMWIGANSRREWRTEETGVLQSMGSQSRTLDLNVTLHAVYVWKTTFVVSNQPFAMSQLTDLLCGDGCVEFSWKGNSLYNKCLPVWSFGSHSFG